MINLPENLKYAASHEWVQSEEDNIIRVGISDFAQSELGDLVYVEFPEVGRKLKAGEQCAIVESVKIASDLFAPVSGEIIEINEEISDEPELVNDEPYDSWLFAIKANDLNELENLMTADAYQKMIEESS